MSPQRRVCLLVLLTVLAACLAGCSGGGQPPPTVNTALTPAQHLGTINDISNYFAALPHTDLPTENQQLVTYMQSLPLIAAAGLTTGGGGAWCRFTDGRLVAVSNNRLVTPPAAPEALMTPRAVHCGLPGPLRARLLRSMGTAFPDIRADLKSWLQSAGYQVTTGSATIENLRRVRGDGIVYLDGHGLAGIKLPGGALVSAFWTADAANATSEAAYGAEWADGSLVVGIGLQNTGQPPARNFMVTSKFVTDHMSFGRNCFVFMDCCYLNAADFRNACLAKGASLYAGWTAPVRADNAARAARFVFDRLLGANEYAAEPSPEQRPFDYLPVYNDLRTRGWDTSRSASFAVSKLIFTPGTTGDTGLLRPSIKFLTVDELAGTLTLAGLFGKDPGAANRRVTCGGQDLTIQSWGTQKVVCELPVEGPGSSGPVNIIIRGHWSNTVPLTEWHGTFNYTHTDAGTLKYTITSEVWLRADIHAFRDLPHTAPQQTQVPIWASRRSTCTYRCTGGASADGNSETWAGSGSIPLFDATSWAGDYFLCLGSIDAQLHKMRLHFMGVAFSGLRKRMIDSGGHTFNETDGAATEYPEDGDDDWGPYIDLTLNDTYGIAGGNRTGEVYSQSMVDTMFSATGKLQWSLIPATYAPEPGVTPAATLSLAPSLQ